MNERVVRLVIDTQTWMDLLHFVDPGCALLADSLCAGRAIAIRNDPVEREFARVLGYPRIGLDVAVQRMLFQRYVHSSQLFAITAQPRPTPLPRCRDPDDQMFLELAASADADVLVTRDKALLELDRQCRRIGFAVLRADDDDLARRISGL